MPNMPQDADAGRVADELRQRAELELQAQKRPPSMVSDGVEGLLHELRVHEIELGMQNDELRRTQSELEASRAKYFDLYDLAPVGYVTIDHNGDITEANLTAAALLGTPREKLTGTRLSARIVAADQDAYYRFHRRLQTAGYEYECDVRMNHGESDAIWTHLEGSSLHGPEEEGEPRIRITLTDITKRIEAEHGLREAVEQLRLVIENSPDIIFTMDISGVLTFVAASWTEHLGQQSADAVGHHLSEYLHPDDARSWETVLAGIVASNARMTNVEYRIQNRDAAWRWHAATLAASFDDAGIVTALVGNARDITDLKVQQEALERLVMTDLLTGIGNRRYFFESAGAEAERAHRYEYPIAVLVIDVDDLKGLNDTYGHEAGDHALRCVAHECEQAGRESDVVGRLGGDEFAILLSHADHDKALIAAKRLVRNVASCEHGAVLPQTVTVSVGMGVVTSGENGLRDALKLADENLYRAKTDGRNRVRS